MKKMLLIFGAVVSIVIVASVIGFLLKPHGIAELSGIGFNSVNVSDKSIDLKEGGFAASALWYAGYKAEYRNETLYLKIIVSTRELKNGYNPFDISIPNTYGTIKAVYLQGYKDDTRMLWPENTTSVKRDGIEASPKELMFATSTQQ